jgi:hypothetical protein
MDSDQIEHLQRIQRCCDALSRLPWVNTGEQSEVATHLLDFDAENWTLVKYLSLPLYEEVTRLLLNSNCISELSERPGISVIIPVHNANPALLRKAITSSRSQVAVNIDCKISIDGRLEDYETTESILSTIPSIAERWQASITYDKQNKGVGMCRNQALRKVTSQYFTCLDADDFYHPLRCLHSLLLLLDRGLDRVNTGYSRVSARYAKIILLNGSTFWSGNNSFLARTDLLRRYGYFADLRYHEDTEYMNRLAHFGVPMMNSAAVGHYQHYEADWDYESLSTSTHTRREVHTIENHPYLAGSVITEMTEDRQRLERQFTEIYQSIIGDSMGRAFPPDLSS